MAGKKRKRTPDLSAFFTARNNRGSDPVRIDNRTFQTFLLGIAFSFIVFYMFSTGVSELVGAHLSIPIQSREIDFWSASTYLVIVFSTELWMSFTLSSILLFNSDFMATINFMAWVQTIGFMFVYSFIIVVGAFPQFVVNLNLFLAGPVLVLVKVFKSADLFFFVLLVIYTEYSILSLKLARVIEIE